MPLHTRPVSHPIYQERTITYKYHSDLVSSTLSDPYLSYSAALFALAGPLHGLVVLFDELQSSTDKH